MNLSSALGASARTLNSIAVSLMVLVSEHQCLQESRLTSVMRLLLNRCLSLKARHVSPVFFFLAPLKSRLVFFSLTSSSPFHQRFLCKWAIVLECIGDCRSNIGVGVLQLTLCAIFPRKLVSRRIMEELNLSQIILLGFLNHTT